MEFLNYNITMKKKSRLFCGLLILVAFGALAFKFPEFKAPKMPPYIKYRLSKWPLIGRFVKPPPPPEKEYLATKKLLADLDKARADRYAPELYREIHEKWQRAEKYYHTGHYDWAVYYFKKIRDLSREALTRARSVREKKKKEALTVLKKLKSSYEKRKRNLSLEKRLKIELALWRLETLIELEKFDRFATEAREVRKNYHL